MIGDSIITNFLDVVNDSCKELVQIIGINPDDVDIKNTAHFKELINGLGYNMQCISQIDNPFDQYLELSHKGKFVSGYRIIFDQNDFKIKKFPLLESAINHSQPHTTTD